MTVDELRRRLRLCHARLGLEGRLALTLSQEPGEPCYLTHWVRPDGAAFEDCRAVGQGTLETCLEACERYADQWQRKPTVEEVGRTLGLPPPADPARYRIAAE